jgi:hypothetical protein
MMEYGNAISAAAGKKVDDDPEAGTGDLKSADEDRSADPLPHLRARRRHDLLALAATL